MKNELPSWFCQVCHSTYYTDVPQDSDCECSNCGAVYKPFFTVTETKHNADGTYTDIIVHQKEMK